MNTTVNGSGSTSALLSLDSSSVGHRCAGNTVGLTVSGCTLAEVWSLTAVVYDAGGQRSRLRRTLTPSSNCKFNYTLGENAQPGTLYSFQACRACENCLDTERLAVARPHDVRSCGSRGVCTNAVNLDVEACADDSTLLERRPVHLLCTADLLHGRGRLAQGYWVRRNGTESFHHGACTFPSLAAEHAHRSVPHAARFSVVFIGDSSLEDHALEFAHSSGYKFEELDYERYRRVAGRGSIYRIFNATGRHVDIAMRWSGGMTVQNACGGLRMAPSWWHGINETLRIFSPQVVVFNIPAAHLLCACSIYHRPGACTTSAVQADMVSFMRALVNLGAAGTTFMMMTTGVSYSRTPDTGIENGNQITQYCNVDLYRLQLQAMRAFETLGLGRRGIVLDSFGLAYSWLDLRSASEPFTPACSQQYRHCSCMGQRSPVENDKLFPNDILPPCHAVTLALAASIRSSLDARL